MSQAPGSERKQSTDPRVAEKRLRALRRRCEEAERELEAMRRQLERLRDAPATKLGQALTEAQLSRGNLLGLASELWRLRREALADQQREPARPGEEGDPDGRMELELAQALRHAKPGAALRVLHVSRVFSSPSETFTYDLVTALDRRQAVDNYVLCLHRRLVEERPFAKTFELSGLSREALIDGDAELVLRLDRVLEELTPRLIHCHFGSMGLPLSDLLTLEGRRIPLVISMHGPDVNVWPRRFPWYAATLAKLESRSWVQLVTHSRVYRDKLVALGVPNSQIDIVPNSFSPHFRPELDPERPCLASTGVFRIICIARFEEWKGHDVLLRAFARFVREVHRSSELTLVGYGPREQDLKALAKELKIKHRVSFRGRVPHVDIPVLLRHHDAYVQPSVRHPQTLQEEGQPVVLLEAIASGLPVVVTHTGAMAETVRVGPYEGCAFVVRPNDPEALCAALAKVIESGPDRERLAKYAHELASRHHQEAQVDAMLRVYERCLLDPALPARAWG